MMRWLGFTSLVCFTVCYIPQLIRTYRTKEVAGVSPFYWAVLVVGYMAGLFYVWALGDRLLWLTYVGGLFCCLAMLAACVLFRKR